MNEPDYLFDKQGEPPPDVQRLEGLLGRFAHGNRERRRELPPPSERRSRRWPWLLSVAAVVPVAYMGWRTLGRPGSDPRATVNVVRTDGSRLDIDEWVEAGAEAQHLSGDFGWLTLAAGARLHVRRLDADQSRFYLDRGNMEAFVFPQVKARFFQVETAATTCVDLGCKYTLDVDPQTKVAHVVVTMGQVAFVENGREVFIPRGAECRAVPGVGAGTPRFTDCPAPLRAKLDAFDAAREPTAQRAAMGELVAAATTPRDTLPLYHALSHADAEVRAAADQALETLVGAPKAGRTVEAWRDFLEHHWW